MNLFNRNTNKRKLNKQKIGCFKRYCTRKKHENMLKSLKQSTLNNESYYDPCIQYDVQYGPNTWEDIGRDSNRKFYDDKNQALSIERVDVFYNMKNNVNSFINDSINDGMGQISVIITTVSPRRYKQKEFRTDNQNFRLNQSKKNSCDTEEKHQILKKASHTAHQSSENTVDDYNWNLLSNENNIDQEPYNWEYQWSPASQSLNKIRSDQSKSSLTDNNDIISSDNHTSDPLYNMDNNMKSGQQNDSKNWTHTNSDQLRMSLTNLSENNDARSAINSTHSSIFNNDKFSKNLSSEILHQHESNPLNNTDSTNENKSTNSDISAIHTQSHQIDRANDQQSGIYIKNPFNQLRSTYDDIMISWRPLLERIIGLILRTIPNTDHNINTLPSSIITSNTHSWSTFLPAEPFNMVEYDNIGPWWSRRDTYDQTPSTFIFTNESSTNSYSTVMITNNTEISTSIDRNTHHRYCN